MSVGDRRVGIFVRQMLSEEILNELEFRSRTLAVAVGRREQYLSGQCRTLSAGL